MKKLLLLLTALALALMLTPKNNSITSAQDEPVRILMPVELSGTGVTAGTNWQNGALLAQEQINAEGGILGRQIEFEILDTQSDPATSRSVIARGLDNEPYAILGPLFSGSIIVNMLESERAMIPQIMGGEAANLTEQGHQYVFRTSFGQTVSMPKITRHIASTGVTSVAVIWINNDFGKGGHDNAVAGFEAAGVEVAADISTEPGQIDYAPEVLEAIESGADAIFAYLNEEESARLLIEIRAQEYDKPVFGETVLLAQSVIDLAGEAANGIQGHVGLSAIAPVESIEAFTAAFEEKYDYIPDHNGLKGYIGLHIIKEVAERMGDFNSAGFADALHCTFISTEDEPGVLLDVAFNEKGDIDRESFLVEIVDGKQVITEVLPRLGDTCGEPEADADATAEPTEEAD
jgi:branched-chain amino acid transport system substrate-binding protein